MRWRWLRIGGLTAARLLAVAVAGLALWGLPAPPAIRDEGHGLERPLNQLYVGALASEFMERCLAR